MVQEAQIAWAAGLFEGEGCVHFGWQKGNPKYDTLYTRCDISIGMHSRDADILEKFLKIVGVGKIYGPYKKPILYWKIYTYEDAMEVLPKLYPYLGSRRQNKIDEFYDFFKHKGK